MAAINKFIMIINSVFVAVYLLIFQNIPLIGRFVKAIAASLPSEQLATLERILIYGIGILTVLSLLLLAVTLKGPLLQITVVLFAAYVAHIFIGKVSVAFYSKFFKPWGIPDPWATVLLFTTAVLFTISMLLREAQFGKRNVADH